MPKHMSLEQSIDYKWQSESRVRVKGMNRLGGNGPEMCINLKTPTSPKHKELVCEVL